MSRHIYGWVLLLSIAGQGVASAQNFSFDARKIALGGVGAAENIAEKTIEEQRSYGSFPLPFGLVQLVTDIKRVNPKNDEFDPARLFEYAASPVHYVVNRGAGDTGTAFLGALVNGRLGTDLTAYSGFEIADSYRGEGLASPNWGKTIKVYQHGNNFHGVYVGAGPYLGVRTALDVDGRLRDVLGGGLARVPNASLRLDNNSEGQIAAAFTGGYRGRFGLGNGTSERDGLYVAANYHYLHGFRYESAATAVRFETNDVGLIIDRLAPDPIRIDLGTDPLVIDAVSAKSGKGFALDVGVGAVVNRWEVGFGVNGIANRIDWSNFERTRYSFHSVLDGSGLQEQSLAPGVATMRVTLPVNYVGNAAYHHDRWSVLADFAHGFNGDSFHGGFEQRFGLLELRGGGRYSRQQWHPTGGAGLNLSRHVGLDFAAFTTNANLARTDKLALAVSVRLNHLR
jgi:hypothetical protein